LPDGVKAFTAIARDIGLVFHFDYRHETFKKWKHVVETALELYLGALHPITLEFQGVQFKDPSSSEAPAGQPVTATDELMYSNGLETTKGLLERARDEVKVCEDAEAKKVEDAKKAKEGKGLKELGEGSLISGTPPAGEPAAPPPVTGIRIVRTKVDEDMAEPGEETDKAGKGGGSGLIQRQASATPASKPGGARKDTLEGVIKGMQDPAERELVIRLTELLDEPRPEWNDIRSTLLAIHTIQPELAQRLFPLILNR